MGAQWKNGMKLLRAAYFPLELSKSLAKNVVVTFSCPMPRSVSFPLPDCLIQCALSFCHLLRKCIPQILQLSRFSGTTCQEGQNHDSSSGCVELTCAPVNDSSVVTLQKVRGRMRRTQGMGRKILVGIGRQPLGSFTSHLPRLPQCAYLLIISECV